MPSTPHHRMVLSTFVMMVLQVSLCRTSPVNLVCSNGSPALTGHYLVDILPQPDIFSAQKHFVASGRQVLPLIGVADLESGDLVGAADAPLLRILLGALQHPIHAVGPHPGQSSDRLVSAVASSTDAQGIAPAVPPPSPTLMERLNPAQRSAFYASGPDSHRTCGRSRSTYTTPFGTPRPLSNWGMCSATFLTCSPPRRRILGHAP